MLLLFWQFTIKTIGELDIVSNQNLSIEMFLIRLMHIVSIKKILNLKLVIILNYQLTKILKVWKIKVTSKIMIQ